ncbi:phospholipase A, partial [Shewanella sp. 0m-11]
MNKLSALLIPLCVCCSFTLYAADTQSSNANIEVQPKKERSLVDKRISEESATGDLPYVITPHKVNYILPVTYSASPNMAPFAEEAAEHPFGLDNMEAKFQISFKFPLWHNVFGDNGHLFAAYTNQSYWQVYNKEISSPF